MGHPSSIAPGPSTCLPLVPQSPPPHRARPKSIFSRLRRTAIPMSMSATSHLVQADAIVVPVGVSSNKGKWDKRASRKAPPPPLPPQPHVPSFEEEVVDEVEWDRVRTLPRVRLIPPEEDESEPVMLYPLPHLRPLITFPQPPPIPTSPLVGALISTPAQPPPPPPPEARALWGSMSPGFVLPPPVFKRGGSAMGVRGSVVMPRKRSEVVADRERRMSRFVDKEVWVAEATSTEAQEPPPPMSPPPTIMEELDGEREEAGQPVAESPTLPEHPSFQPAPPADDPAPLPPPPAPLPRPPGPLRADSAPSSKTSAPGQPNKPRALSLTSALAAQIEPIVPHDEEVPALPTVYPKIRKQKSLKKFFFTNDSLPLPEEAPKKPRSLLSRVKSKPSLRIDVKASKESPSPGLTTASSSGQSEGYPDRPRSAHRGLTKRFSLSNMSAALKKRPLAIEGEGEPRVPQLPEEYRREKERVLESALPIKPRRFGSSAENSHTSPNDSPRTTVSATHDSHTTLRCLQSPLIIRTSMHIADAESDASSAFELDDELQHAEFMHVSPRTRNNPGVSLQEFLGTAPRWMVGVVVVPNTSRYIVEAIVPGELLIPEGKELPTVDEVRSMTEGGESDSETSLASLSRSSSSSEPDTHPITPNIPMPAVLASPVQIDSPIASPSETPTTSSTRASTPRTRTFGSPDILYRMITSPRPKPLVKVPVPPPIPVEEEYSSLAGECS